MKAYTKLSRDLEMSHLLITNMTSFVNISTSLEVNRSLRYDAQGSILEYLRCLFYILVGKRKVLLNMPYQVL